MTSDQGDPRSASVLIVSASMGGGHDGAANELARRLRARGQHVDLLDFLTILPLGTGWLIRWIYARQLRFAPSTYDALYTGIQRRRSLQWVSRWFSTWGNRRLARATAGRDVVVATYPLAGQALGRLRRTGRLRAAFVMYLTDFSVHPLWVVDEADEHLVLHEVTAELVRSVDGDAVVRVGGALVRPEFLAPSACDAERARWRAQVGIPEGQVAALLVAGSWGVGDVLSTAREISAGGAAHPVVLCGRNERLRRSLTDEGVGVALGWTDDMAGLLRVIDVVVQNAGGLTSLEAFAAGVPVVSARCLAGHGHDNAEAMDRAGVARHLCGRESIVVALGSADLGAAVDRARDLFTHDPTTAIVSAANHRVAARPLVALSPPMRTRPLVPRPAVRPRLLAAGAAALAAVLVAGTAGTATAASHGIGVARPSQDQRRHAVFVVVVLTSPSSAWPASPDAGDPTVTFASRPAAHDLTGEQAVMLASAALRAPKGVATDPKGRPLVLLPQRTNAWELLRVRLSHDVGVVPNVVVRSTTAVPTLRSGQVVVVDGRALGSARSAALVDAIALRAHAQGLSLEPMSELGRTSA